MADYFLVGAKSTQAAFGKAYPSKPIEVDSERLPPPYSFTSRRSPLICAQGCVSSSQPLASQVGVDILKRGGNAADAAVAVAAALAVMEPCSTGLGGDVFALYYDAASKSVQCINGSGRAPMGLTREIALSVAEEDERGEKKLPKFSVHTVTVPGAAR